MKLGTYLNSSWLGRWLRQPLKLLPKTLVVPILQGKMRGKKWIVGSYVHGCWLGHYEYRQRVAFEETVKPGDIVFDIGAHVGFYSLLAATLVGPTGKVLAFEPLPRNLFYLREHLRLNRINNVTVIEAAAADKTGFTFFDLDMDHWAGHLANTGELQVKTVRLDDLYEQGEIPGPNYMKIDVEGAEFLVLQGSRDMLQKLHPTLLLTTHNVPVHNDCCDLLRSLGYQWRSLGTDCDAETDNLLVCYP